MMSAPLPKESYDVISKHKGQQAAAASTCIQGKTERTQREHTARSRAVNETAVTIRPKCIQHEGQILLFAIKEIHFMKG